jgi:hypothetical protein
VALNHFKATTIAAPDTSLAHSKTSSCAAIGASGEYGSDRIVPPVGAGREQWQHGTMRGGQAQAISLGSKGETTISSLPGMKFVLQIDSYHARLSSSNVVRRGRKFDHDDNCT